MITRAQGKVLTVIFYSKEQVDDMKRCCSPGPNGVRSVMTFDKTFNLASLHVTAAVYQNVASVNSRTMEHAVVKGVWGDHLENAPKEMGKKPGQRSRKTAKTCTETRTDTESMI